MTEYSPACVCHYFQDTYLSVLMWLSVRRAYDKSVCAQNRLLYYESSAARRTSWFTYVTSLEARNHPSPRLRHGRHGHTLLLSSPWFALEHESVSHVHGGSLKETRIFETEDAAIIWMFNVGFEPDIVRECDVCNAARQQGDADDNP